MMIVAAIRCHHSLVLAVTVFLYQAITPSRTQLDVTLGLLVPFGVNYSSSGRSADVVSGRYYASAISLAVETINSDVNLLANVQLRFIWNDTSCEEGTLLQAISEQWSRKVNAFIGPACLCTSAAKLATAWNMPIISYMCEDARLSDKRTYPTFSRTVSSPGRPVLAVLQHFNWSWVGLITEDSVDWRERGANIQRTLVSNNVTVRLQRVIPSIKDYTANKTALQLTKVLQDMREVCRVFILAMDYTLAREVMFSAGELGMGDGRFAYIAFALDLNTIRTNTGNPSLWFAGRYGSQAAVLTDQSRGAFGSMILLAARTTNSAEYANFTAKLKQKSPGAPFFSDVYNGNFSKLEPPLYAALLYDAVTLYALALNATLESGGSVTDGKQIASHMFQRPFQSILGYQRFVDLTGNTDLDFVMMDYSDVANGTFEEVGYVQVNSHGRLEVSLLGNRSIMWPGGKSAPADKPDCGFYHENCIKRNLTVGLILPFQSAVATGSDFNAGKWYASAMEVAFRKVNNDSSFLPGVNLKYIWNGTACEEERSLRNMVWQFQQNVDGFIGFGCTCAAQARLAAAWNLPVISYMCTDDKVSNKDLYPTFARTIFGDRNLGPSVLALMTHFGWNRVGIISEEDEAWRRRGDFLENFLTAKGKTVAAHEHVPFYLYYDRQISLYGESYRRIMERMKKTARIIIFVTHRRLIREGMYYASKLGMNNGDFAFFMFELDSMKVQRYQSDPSQWFRGNYKTTKVLTNAETEELMKAYQNSLLLVSSRSEFGEYDEFLYKMKKAMSEPPFSINTYDRKFVFGNRTIDTFNVKPPVLAGYLYDAAHLYAIAVNRTLAAGGDPTNGSEVMTHIFGRKFPSILGYDLLLDTNGDVVYNLTLLNLRGGSDGYRFVPVGKFELEESNNYTQLFVKNKNSSFVWLNGKPPVDVPKCGFNNEYCIDNTYELGTMEIVSICLASILVVFLIVGVVIYRKQKLERELASNAWKVNYNEITLRTKQPGSLRSQVSILTSDTFENIGHRQLFTTVGTYRSTVIALKKVNKRSIELTRDIKIELKQMRDVRHDNLTPFIGACVDARNICILFQYCPKGSLQDILENEDVKLDSMFITSLVTDIVNGMSYLHSTEIKSHGNLKSSNCVVDGRWVLKITDYGLNKFKSNQENWDDGEYSKYYRRLWCAPEILRMKTPPCRGTQKGDVYSFSIVLQELLTRAGPFDMCDFHTEPKEIVQRVKCLESPPFRPTLANAVPSSDLPGLRQLIEKCWNEAPELRPDFAELKRHVRKVSTGKHASIMDNMVNMLEKYANNLESLVEERTSQLAEEKRKTLNLLHRMLPPTVARDLINGKAVSPENFDEVSIFFSDIVGFTSLSSESSPIQVVDMLNDLYTLFDAIISYYDVYKVETIGDAYMVVSGLPIRNSRRHAGEIAEMALHMCREILHFKIRHRDGQQLQLRIGIHSGPVVAGVVGNTMPRYCLFGDTVNTASRMESNGEAMKIHISFNTKIILDALGGYRITRRGEVFLKGKGNVTTYWLDGCDHPLRKHGQPLTKTKSDHSIAGKRKESGWKVVKDLLPKLSHEHLPPVKTPRSATTQSILAPVTS